jgi:hypothetical protein
MVIFFVSLLAAKGLQYLSSGLTAEKIGHNFFTLFILLVITAEFLAIPYPIDHVTTPDIYSTIAEDPETVSVLSLPYLAKHSLSARQQYYQTIHHKPLLFGYLGRAPMEILSYHMELPVLRTFIQMNKGLYPGPEQLAADNNIAHHLVNFLQLKYIVVDTRYYTDEQLSELKEYVHKVFPVESSILKNFQLLYTIDYNPYPPGSLYITGETLERNLYLLKGWDKQSPENPEETFLRADLKSELVFFLTEGNYRFTMDCRLSEGTANGEIRFNDRLVERHLLDDSWRAVSSEQRLQAFQDGYYRLALNIYPEQVSHRKVPVKLLVRTISLTRQ